MADPQDVTPASSPGSAESPPPDATATPGVTGVAEGADRPIENLKGEFDRKLSRVERQLAEMAAMIAAQQSPRAEAPPSQEYTDQQLLELSNAGNTAAQQEYTRRIVAQQVGQQEQARQYQQMIAGQLQAVYARYPVLTDPLNPLTQAAMQVKLALVRLGYPAQSPATDLEAIKAAIVDNPGLVQPAAGPAPSEGRVRSPQQGIDGATSRRPHPTTTPGRPLSQKERDIAQRMGIKDPVESVKRFEKRLAESRSNISPLIAQIVREEST